MKIMLVIVVAGALAASGCACPCPKSGSSDNRHAYKNDSQMDSTGRVDGDRELNAGRTGYDNSGTDGITTYRTSEDPSVVNGTAWTPSADADARSTSAIRTRITSARLSMNARNASVTTENGRVTLRGRVDSDQERETIARIARDVAGDGNVDDHLDVVMAR